jgi:hypothetical protein
VTTEFVVSPYIEAWGLDVADSLEGTLEDITPAWGCVSETCRHASHDPAAPNRRWVPGPGYDVVELGYESDDIVRRTWYLIIGPGDVKFARLEEPRGYHASLYREEGATLPRWVANRYQGYLVKRYSGIVDRAANKA